MNRPLALALAVADEDGRVGAVAVADGADGVTVIVVEGDCAVVEAADPVADGVPTADGADGAAAVLDGVEPGDGLTGAAALLGEELTAGQGWPFDCST
jgi:hypothetical protein